MTRRGGPPEPGRRRKADPTPIAKPLLAAAAVVLTALLTGAGHVADVSAQAPGGPTIRIGVQRNGGYDVVTLPVEVYVGRVLTGEAAPESAPAALEALAIAIRTYTVTNRGRHRADNFDLCDQTHCQVMRGATPASDRAALATADQILLYQGAPATVYYSASCGGRSEKPSNVWPGAADPPYLSVHDDDGCGGFPVWSAELARPDLQRALVAGGYRGTLRDVRIAARNDAGRVATLTLDGMTPREISGQDLRMVVGRTLGFQHIQSTAFELRRTASAFRFSGRGAGHAVGLCVIGSMKLAAAGQSAATILARYFPGTQIGSAAARLTGAPSAPSAGNATASAAAPAAPATAAPATRTVPSAPAVDRAAVPSADGLSRPAAAPAVATPADASAGNVVVSLPDSDAAERPALVSQIARERDAVAHALGEAPMAVRFRFHDSAESYERATRRPWFTFGATQAGEAQLMPVTMLRDRGVLERIVRRQLVHLFADPVLPERPAWVRVGVGLYFSGPGVTLSTREPCPQDVELDRPTSIGALADAYARARGCVERQLGSGRDWRRVR